MTDAVKDLVETMRGRLGAVGVWSGHFMAASPDEERRAAQTIEHLGYGSIWSGELVTGKDIFSQAATILAATSTIVVGSGIANLWARHPAKMQGGASTLGSGWPDRFINGIGVSHQVFIDATGQSYTKPLERMRNYLKAMDEAIAESPVTPRPVPRLLAALRPKMLELARESAHGAHPYFVPPSHTPLARSILGPDRLLIPEQAVVLCADPGEARRIARTHVSVYLTLPNYCNSLRELGYGDEDLAGAGSDRLVDAVVAWGDEQAIAARIAELRASGADHVVIQPLGDSLQSMLAQVEALAPAIVGGDEALRPCQPKVSQ
jgi:probable F420-dependent oxidoreductase